MVAVVGRLFQKWFPASPNLAYTFIWDKTDAYNQKVYGLSEAVGKFHVNMYPARKHCLDVRTNIKLTVTHGNPRVSREEASRLPRKVTNWLVKIYHGKKECVPSDGKEKVSIFLAEITS